MPLDDTPKSFPGGHRDIRRKLQREPVAAAAARRELESLSGDLDRQELQVIALLMTELIANSVKHAGPDAGEVLGLEVAVMPERIRVEVRDGGNGFVSSARDDADPDAHWGLHLVDRMSSRWEVVIDAATDQTVVWFELDRRGRAA
jgi:two-component sensor histidine kinase